MARQGRHSENRVRKSNCPLVFCVVVAVLLTFQATGLAAQNQLPDGPTPQNNAPRPLPDGPTPQNNAPSTAPQSPGQPVSPPVTPPPNEAAPGTDTSASDPSRGGDGNDATAPDATPSAPAPGIATVPPGTAPPGDRDAREQLYRFSKEVNAVTVPVSVKDSSGHLVAGLLAKDFAVYEDGVRQRVTFFTSDPFPLSAAVVIDMGMPDNVLSKIRNTLSALVGAFGQFDEVAVYSYGNTVKKWQDFTAIDKISPTLMKQLKQQKGSAAGAPVVGGPLGQSGPVINGRNAADNTPNIPSMPSSSLKQSRVLNDAILAAARDLAQRDGALRRRILFVISDGREVASETSYADVMKVLLSNGITVYAVGVGGAGIPGYRTLDKIHIPGTGYGNILDKYASATGGQVFPKFDEQAIETAYSQVTEEARNQYTLGYQTRATPSSAYRSIEVKVTRGDLHIFAKDGYYPLPPRRQGSAQTAQP